MYGDQDQLGCLNLLTAERTLDAMKLAKSGEVFSLNAPLDYPSPHPASKRRKPPMHVVTRYPQGRDDHFDGFFPQSGSQWDGFLHVYDEENECFYNGNTNESLGIEAWGRRGIVGRGVLLDAERWLRAEGRPLDWQRRDEISVADLKRCAESQQTTIEPGTILIIRTGWETGWNAATFKERVAIAQREFQCPGLEPSPAMVELLWDWGVAAIGSDNYALEAFPLDAEYFMHVALLVRAGVPIGEFWHLDDLAEVCAREERYEFFFTSAPFNAKGGIGSTANALAIM